MPSMSSMPIDTRQIERAIERGRARIESIADTIAHGGGELIEDLRHEAVPLLERAAAPPGVAGAASRKPKGALVILGLMAIAGVVAYLFWQRRDEQPAYLMHSPDQPDLTPVRTPPSAPSDGPAEPQPGEDEPTTESPLVPRRDTTSTREFAGAPHAVRGHREVHDARPVKGGRILPGAGTTPFATSPVQLPSNPRRSWLPR